MDEFSKKGKVRSPLQAEQLFDRSEAGFNLLIDSVKDYAIFMLDPQGYIKSWNTGAQNIKGYSKTEIINKHFSIFYIEEDIQRNHPAYELKVAAKEGTFEEEGWRVKKDGDLFWAHVLISAIYDTKQQLIGFSKITRDLTERKALEDQLRKKNQELQESEERARLLIAGVKDYAIYLLTPEGNIASWNEGAKRLKGYDKEEVIGLHFSKFYTEDSIAANFPQFELAKALEDGRFEDEGWRIKKDGSLFWANVVITPIINSENRHIGFTKITRDLSERVRNENLMKKNIELLRVNTDLDNFVYTASHDLKSPIGNLAGLLSLMEQKIKPKLNEPETKILQLMENSIQKLNNTIESLIEVTKAQKNLDAQVEVISIQEVLQDVLEELSTQISVSGAVIQADFSLSEVNFPKSGLRSILYNLLSNAIKYRSKDRKLIIQIQSFKEENKIALRVQDNGLGLTKAQEAKLFTMFRRFHSHIAGTGIGLYIVKRTLENYGGKIKVQSRLNEGTEFVLYYSTA